MEAYLVLIMVLTFAFCWSAPAAAQDGREGITQQYRKALEMNPDDMDARYLLGVSMLREKAYNEALQHLIKVYPHRSGEADMNYNIGLAYAGAGELKKAFRHYMRVDEINAIEARDKYHLDTAFYNLGISYQKEGNLDEALRCYQEAIQINPEQVNAFCAKGEALYQKKDYKGALESLTVCKERGPERKGITRYISAIHQGRGIEYIYQKNYTEARIALDKAITLDPSNETAHYYMGYLEYLEGDYKKALLALDKVKGTEREDMKKALSSMLYNVGGAMQKDEDWEGAINAFSQAAIVSKQDPELRFYLGYSNMKAKRFDAAIEAFKETLKLDPKHQRAAINLAIVSEIAMKSHLSLGEDYLKNGSYNEALEEFNLSLSIDPGNQKGLKGKETAEREIENLKGLAQEKRKREIGAKLLEGDRFIAEEKYLEAKKSFEDVAALEPGNQKAREGIDKTAGLLKEAKEGHKAAGEKASADGRHYSASVEYRKALEYDPGDKALSEILTESLKVLSEKVSPIMKEAQGYEDSHSFAEAVTAFQKVLDIHPDHKAALEGKRRASENLERGFNEALSKGREHAKAGELMKAAENLGRALDLKPDNEKAIEEFRAISGRLQKVVAEKLADAASSLKAGRYSEAMANYRAVLIIEKENREAASGIQNVARIKDEIVGKSMSAGIRAYKEGSYSQALSAFGDVLQVDSIHAEAQKMQRETRERIDEVIGPWLKAGADAYKKGDTDAAIVSFKKVLNVDPANKEAKEHLGKMDTRKAKASVEKEIEKHYLKGIELYTDGKYREAIESWKKVLELDSRHEKAILNIEKAKRKMEGVMDTK